MIKIYPITLICLFSLVICTTSCNDDDENTPSITEEAKTQVLENYATIVLQSYQDALDQVKTLQTEINEFVASPTAESFAAAKQAWLDTREPYGQTEVYRFYNGPIDNETDGPEGSINAWPLDEGYIDYVEGNATSGIINDPTETIDETNLRRLNELGNEANISIGFHAIEFLLWGQDNDVPSVLTAGQRDFTDYTTAANADRRATYLQLCTQLLIDDLQSLVDAWAVGASFRTSFVNAGDASLANILTGMGTLSNAELRIERMRVALLNHDQEDEHSCFSDNTHRDAFNNAKGIQNVYLGTYANIQGSSLSSLVATLDAELDTRIKSKLDAMMTTMTAIDSNKPFDFLISSSNSTGNALIENGVDALDEVTTEILAIAALLDLTVNTDL